MLCKSVFLATGRYSTVLRNNCSGHNFELNCSPGGQESPKNFNLISYVAIVAGRPLNRQHTWPWVPIAAWGEESVHPELRTNKRNAHIYAKITKGMEDKGYARDVKQCWVKIKELRLSY